MDSKINYLDGLTKDIQKKIKLVRGKLHKLRVKAELEENTERFNHNTEMQHEYVSLIRFYDEALTFLSKTKLQLMLENNLFDP